jgi:glycerol-3-phosphate acyltransferase PlsY
MQSIYWFLVGFIAGSIPFSLWVGKIAIHTDIRTVGDGNPGGTNVWKAGGRFWAILAVLLDGFKGAIPVGLAYYVYKINGWMLIPVALAPLLGHMFSPFLKFHGGKGLATTFGIWLGLTSWLGPTALGLSFFA